MPFFSVNGQEIYAHVEGNHKKQLVLLIHGWSSSWYAMSPLMPYFKQRFYSVAIDLPGYGQSPKAVEPVSMDWYADILAELIRQLSPDQPAILVGHSMGGMISLTLTMRHPEMVERLILLCPTISGHLSMFINAYTRPVVFLEWVPLVDKLAGLLEPYVMGVTDRIMRPASFAAHSDVNAENYERLREDARRPGQGRIRAECFVAMRKGDLRGHLRKVAKPPALVIWGMEDNTVPLRDASALVEEWPEADLRILPRVSHWPQFEAPELTQRHIKGFLGTPLKLMQVLNI